MRANRLVVGLSAWFIVGGLVASGAAEASSRASAFRGDPTAVIGIIDSGINPYHVVFRDDSPLAQKHPSTYIPGFPKTARALELTLDAKDYKTAVGRDCELWKNVKPGKLYWFPGTKIIGGISFEEASDFDCGNTNFSTGRIIDGAGHGTMVASRAAGNGYGACPACRIVSIQGLTPGVEWAARNAEWIDVQSNS